MSIEYDLYLIQHKTNVKIGYDWMRANNPEIFEDGHDYEWQIAINHDTSKDSEEEYTAYDAYFYGGNRTAAVVRDFNFAWLNHIHKNLHHWQHWVLINDDSNDGTFIPDKTSMRMPDTIRALDMPKEYIIEMVCDWWAFSWASGNLREVFKWYDEHKGNMVLTNRTRAQVESLLYIMETKLEEDNE